MEITLEQVEKVRSCTGASYEEAKAALEKTGGNVLDAVILLERQGEDGPVGGDYSTRAPGAGAERQPLVRRRPSGQEVWRVLRSLAANCLSISLEIWKDGRMTCMIPLIAALILIVVAPYVCIGLALAGLCFGYHIHISGKGTEEWGMKVNQVMDQIGDTVSDAMAQLRGDKGKKHRKK